MRSCHRSDLLLVLFSCSNCKTDITLIATPVLHLICKVYLSVKTIEIVMDKQTRIKTTLERIQNRHGFNKSELAEALGVSRPTPDNWVKGHTSNPEEKQIKTMSRLSGLDADWIRDGTGSGNTTEHQGSVQRVPIISWVQAGNWEDILDEFEPGAADDWAWTAEKVGQRTYALRIVGDSMLNPHGSPSLAEGTIIIVDPDVEPQNGSLVVAKQQNVNQATCKRFIVDGADIYLRPLNPDYKQIIVDEDCEIVGTVVASYFKHR